MGHFRGAYIKDYNYDDSGRILAKPSLSGSLGLQGSFNAGWFEVRYIPYGLGMSVYRTEVVQAFFRPL